jgi:tetratricopeptide (TPR) repeat protein
MGMARTYKARGNYDSAIHHTRIAIRGLSESSFIAFLGDLYELKGDTKKAAEVRGDVKRLLQKAADEEKKDALVRHNGARELAQAYLATKEYDKAIEFAKQDYDMRPNNIDAAELMAWASYLKGDLQSAKGYAEKSLQMNTKNATTMYKAGMILSAAGDQARGAALKQEALAIMPYIDQRLIAGGR